MKLPLDSTIAPEKLTHYLLVFNEQSDKSKFLEKGGYTLDNWEALEEDLRKLLNNEAVFQKEDTFGEYFIIIGEIANGLNVKTIWLRESGSEVVRFITLIPMAKF
ncbi:MAG: hypothetical protein Q7T20_19300 [Saprospiraceae bacterium]|nr:hypothetical protein [Saprospiraceae bacterium]